MKIKLKDYSLISNEWIDKKLDNIRQKRHELTQEGAINYFSGYTSALEDLIHELIPSEELARVCWRDGSYFGENRLSLNELINKLQDFLNSEIEIQ